ncbi:unnamed protein product [Arabis nemorensis]|uniref:RRM domain-containing protein n=1 Tax=Arabis nemorensis TaxID=586526 RepID=A0A565AS67_9BRAS|nr:unnamed protein product [Arabis nemorensis]
MAAKIHVGNLSLNTTLDTFRQAFSDDGQVLDAIVMTDTDTGMSRGFGYVTYSTVSEAGVAIEEMNDQGDFEKYPKF